MAKTSMVERNNKRRRLAKKFKVRRTRLKAIAADRERVPDSSHEFDAEPADVDVDRGGELLANRARRERGGRARVGRVALDDGDDAAERGVGERERGDRAADHASADDDDMRVHAGDGIVRRWDETRLNEAKVVRLKPDPQ